MNFKYWASSETRANAELVAAVAARIQVFIALQSVPLCLLFKSQPDAKVKPAEHLK